MLQSTVHGHFQRLLSTQYCTCDTSNSSHNSETTFQKFPTLTGNHIRILKVTGNASNIPVTSSTGNEP